eukprot:1124860-Pleurochrysis_carterae.AAC.1
MGGMIVDEPRPIENCLAVYSPCDIRSSFTPQSSNPYYDSISGPFYKDLRYGVYVYGRSCRMYHWGWISEYKDLLFRQHPSSTRVLASCAGAYPLRGVHAEWWWPNKGAARWCACVLRSVGERRRRDPE